ncbi:MAG: sporulation protein YqfD [Clostridia bacterium]
MILYLLNFCKGVLKISVTGAYLERFFNLCALNNISVWNISKHGLDEVHLNILIEDYTRLQKIISNAKCSSSVIKKSGLPYVLSKIKTRYALILGFFAVFATYFVLTNYLFAIEVIGTDKTAMIYDALEQNNIKIGTKLSEINANEVRNNIILDNDEILWMAINLKGNMATVEVYERDETPEIISKDVACDIIADKTGLIDTIEVLAGEKVVDVGHTFLEGDILVSSEVVNYPQVEDITQRYVHSIANIKASIWYHITRILPSEIYSKDYTGAQIKNYSLIFGKKAINLFKSTSNEYAFYDKIISVRKITLSPSVTIPIYLKTEQYIEYEPQLANINSDVGFSMLEQNLLKSLNEHIDGDIVKNSQIYNDENNIISIQMDIETLENIGVEKER